MVLVVIDSDIFSGLADKNRKKNTRRNWSHDDDDDMTPNATWKAG
jgi:hypothetical protein